MRRKALAFLFLASLLAAGCLKSGDKDAAEAVALVNGVPISSEDVRRELDQRVRKDPSLQATPEAVRESLDVLINRRILIQEAQDRRLTEDDRFRQTIKTFWEQTLVRLLMDRFHEEFKFTAFVTEAEVREYYERLKEKATFQILESKSLEAANEAARAVEAGKSILWTRTVGPVHYADIRSEALEKASRFSPGSAEIFSNGGAHMLVRLVSKEADTPPPFDEIRDKIRASIRERRERALFDEWLGEKRRAADVRLFPEKFKGER